MSKSHQQPLATPAQARDQLLQRVAVNSKPSEVPPIVHEVLQASGQPLDRETRAFLEPRFGYDFSGVRVHTDEKAVASAKAVNALAYTVGQKVVFGQAQYQPQTSRGKEVLTHELTHVVQQNHLTSLAAGKPLSISSFGSAETEAHTNARKSNETTPLAARTLAAHHQLQRLSPDDDPMHRDMLEAWRRKHGLPPEGVSASGERVGPSDAEIKYGGLLTQGQNGPSEAEKDFALFGGTIASYSVDKQGKILGWKMDQIAKRVYEALVANKNAYISINGSYPKGNTEFDPTQPLETVKAALVQWLGTSKIPDIEKRIVTYYGSGGPYPDTIGGEIEVKVAYSSAGPHAVAPGPTPSSSPQPKEANKPKEASTSGVETKIVLIPIAYDDGKVKATATLKASYQFEPIKKVALNKVTVSFGEVEIESEGGIGVGQKVGEKFQPKAVYKAELGASVSLAELKLTEKVGLFPKGIKVGLSLNISGDFVEGKIEPKGELKIQKGPFFFKLEGNTESGGAKLGAEFDIP